MPLARLDLSLRERLEKELPAHLQLPHGRAKMDYTEPLPVAAARAQHFCGLAETPKLAGGRIPLRFVVAGRPTDCADRRYCRLRETSLDSDAAR